MKAPATKPRPRGEPKVPPAWLPPEWQLADAAALQALERGEADAHQQQRALRWIIERAAATYDMPFRPGGDGGSRDTDFACGRMFVGQEIRKLLKINLGAFKER